MATVIYKYPIPTDDFFDIEMPRGAKILCVQTQNGTPCIWVRVDFDYAEVTRKFFLKGTGATFEAWEESGLYIGTFQIDGGREVWHLYEDIE